MSKNSRRGDGTVDFTIIHAAKTYLDRGWQPVPVEPHSKAAVPHWETIDVNHNNVLQHFTEANNIGIRLGPRSRNILDTDIDMPAALAIAARLLPATGMITGRDGKPRSHYFYVSNLCEIDDRGHIAFKHPVTRQTIIEIRFGGGGHNAQTLVPPSVHDKTGEPIVFYEKGDPAYVDGPTLVRIVTKIAVAAIILECYPESGLQARHDYWMVWDGFLSRCGWEQAEREEFIELVATEAGDDDVRDRTLIARHTDKKTRVPGLPKLRELVGEKLANGINSWLRSVEENAFPDLSEKGGLRNTVPNTMIALSKLGYNCRYDVFALVATVDNVPITDMMALQCAHHVHSEFRFYPTKDAVLAAVYTLAYQQRFHPVCDWLDTLAWDGQSRISNWLVIYGGADDTPYVRAIGRIMLMAMCYRVRQPGCKFDEMLVFESEQGKNKSSALAALASPEWFTDSFDLQQTDSVYVLEQTAGKWIVEIPELAGQRQSAVERIKSMASRRTDRARRKFFRETTEQPRQFIFVGTTNDDKYLQDQTGNRRFWPVHVEFSDTAVQWLVEDRDQLFAEADHYCRQGESIRLAAELWPDAAEVQEHRVHENSFTSVICERLSCPPERPDKDPSMYDGRIRTSDIRKLLGVPPERWTNAMEIKAGQAMKELGWERKLMRRGGGERSYYYRRGAPPYDPLLVVIEPTEQGEKPTVIAYEDWQIMAERNRKLTEKF